ncbi:mitochondrial carrier [Mycena floridula]|nr:mitochondrial carrier [Mycena floridula]
MVRDAQLAMVLVPLSAVLFSLLVLFSIIPLSGILVRVRANFVPKRLQLVTEDGEQEGPVIVNSFFGMLKKVYRVEGWAGLFKGFWSYFLMGILASIVGAGALGFRQDGSAFDVQLFRLGKNIIFAVLLLPGNVLIYRSIVTPYRLSAWASWRQNLHILFSPDERRAMWRIYTIPGLAVATVCQAVFVNVLTAILIALLNIAAESVSKKHQIIKAAVVVVLSTVLTTMILPPMEVVMAKLATQRYPGVEEIAEDPHFALAIRYADDGEESLETRQDRVPYTGFVDCVKTVVKEEGWRAMYRAWWVTLVAGVLFFGLYLAVVLAGPLVPF